MDNVNHPNHYETGKYECIMERLTERLADGSAWLKDVKKNGKIQPGDVQAAIERLANFEDYIEKMIYASNIARFIGPTVPPFGKE